MEPSDYDEIPLCKVLYFVRRTDYRRNKADGAHNWLENGWSAWVALCSHPTHNHTDSEGTQQSRQPSSLPSSDDGNRRSV
jgi:hypothetical protein